VLQGIELEIQDLAQFVLPQRPEYDGLVDAVHEFGSEFPPRGFDSGSADFAGRVFVQLTAAPGAFRFGRSEAQTGVQNGTHLRRAQVAGHENQGPREVDAPVVAA
jgi:hypothetical protein